MFEYGYKLDTTKMDNALRRYGQSFAQDDPIVRKGWVVIHRVYLAQQKRNFIARSKGEKVNNIGWPRISMVTAALRRKGGTRKIKTEKSLKAKAAKLPVLRDRGMLIKSLDAGKPGNVQKIGIMRCTAGTKIEYARRHHEGRKSKPPSLQQSLARLSANVAKVSKAGDPGQRRSPTRTQTPGPQPRDQTPLQQGQSFYKESMRSLPNSSHPSLHKE